MRRKLDEARKYGRTLQPIHDLQSADGELSSDDIIAVLDVDEVEADSQPKKATLSGVATIVNQYIAAGLNNQVVYSSGGAFAGNNNLTFDSTTLSANRVSVGGTANASVVPGYYNGTWYAGGSTTTTKPYVLIEPQGTTSTGWSTAGTAFGVNASGNFSGRLFDGQLNGVSNFNVTASGAVTGASFIPTSAQVPANGIYLSAANNLSFATNSTQRLLLDSAGQIEATASGSAAAPTWSYVSDPNTGAFSPGSDIWGVSTGGNERLRCDSSGRLLVGTPSSNGARFEVIETRRLSSKSGASSGWIELTDSANVVSGALTTIATLSLNADNGDQAYFRLEVRAGHTGETGYSSAVSIREGLLSCYAGTPRLLNSTETRNLTGSLSSGVIATTLTTGVAAGSSGGTCTFSFQATATLSGSSSGSAGVPRVSYRLTVLTSADLNSASLSSNI